MMLSAASDEHHDPSQLLLVVVVVVQWTRNILSREYHASALTGCQCKRLRLERGPIQGPREETLACCCHLPPGPRLRKVTASLRSCQWNLAHWQPGTDVRVTAVMRRREVPRLVDSDVDLLQNCNGHSTIIAKARRADDLLIVLHIN
jgi:hypothetical protein